MQFTHALGFDRYWGDFIKFNILLSVLQLAFRMWAPDGAEISLGCVDDGLKLHFLNCADT